MASLKKNEPEANPHLLMLSIAQQGGVMEYREDILMIKSEELKRYQLMGKVFDKSINQQEAAELLGISDGSI